MHDKLSIEEARVLGCLLEKELATPDYYPLTPAALLAACNQLTNREPVVSFDQSTVDGAVMGLRRKGLAAMVHLAGSRVGKLRHLAEEAYPLLDRAGRALLALLLLRGPQTAAELRARGERMHPFAGTEELERTLAQLLENGGDPLAVHLPPGGGRRAATYAHLLCGEAVAGAAALPAAGEVVPPPPDRLEELERQCAGLASRCGELERRLAWLEEALGSRAPEAGGGSG